MQGAQKGCAVSYRRQIGEAPILTRIDISAMCTGKEAVKDFQRAVDRSIFL